MWHPFICSGNHGPCWWLAPARAARCSNTVGRVVREVDFDLRNPHIDDSGRRRRYVPSENMLAMFAISGPLLHRRCINRQLRQPVWSERAQGHRHVKHGRPCNGVTSIT